jgi:hypothetical protein
MSVFTRHRTDASDSARTSRLARRTSVATRMREHRDTMPVAVVGARLSI